MEKEMHHEPHGFRDGVQRASFEMPKPRDGFREMKPEYYIAEEIARNIQAEGDAIKKYMELLGMLRPDEDAGAIEALRDIVAEEKKHVEILQKMQMAYDGCIRPEKVDIPGVMHERA